MIRTTSSIATLIAGSLLITGCATTTGSTHNPADLSFSNDAQAAVIRAMLGDNASALRDSAAAFCIGSGSGSSARDADPAILAALSDNPKVKQASACSIASTGSQVIERSNAQAALLFTTWDVRCVSSSDCTMHGGYYEANLSAQGNLYRARKINGKWAVEVQERGPIS